MIAIVINESDENVGHRTQPDQNRDIYDFIYEAAKGASILYAFQY
jgi:hypothetical protein